MNCAKELTRFERIEQAYECDPACWFREDHINSSTIYKWPVNCTDVCGLMNFYADSDVTVFELQHYFQNLKVLKGGLTMYHTKYASIEFLETLEEVYCDELDILAFAFNPDLEVLNFGDLRNITCNFYAYNNTVLNATSFCEKYVDMTVLFIYDNYKSCEGCVVSRLYSSDLQKYTECKSMINAMWFSYFYTDYDPPIDLSPLANIQNLTGCLAFYNTDFKNMSFFERLENLKSNRYLNNDLSIEMCYNMTRLSFPALKVRVFAKTKYQISFQDNSDSLLNSAACMIFMNDLFDTNVSFNGKECEVIDREKEEVKNSQGIVMGAWQLFLLLFILFL
uniref:Recep_L_domain domain-containing protein n=1 Tax=Caenorhabditis tropicalis TaxID=1561998 RepID=A0A1I7V2I6_9PELO